MAKKSELFKDEKPIHEAKKSMFRKHVGGSKLKDAEKDLGRPLTELETILVGLEGWKAHKDIKGIQTGKGGVVDYKDFTSAIEDKKKTANRIFPDYKKYPKDIQNALIVALFRGDIRGNIDNPQEADKTYRHILSGKWIDASKEFLRHDEYNKYKKQGGNSITDRMEWISEELRNQGLNNAKSK